MKIAIKANPNRGEEIISLLESFGGIKGCLRGDGEFHTYYIDENNKIIYDTPPTDYKIYTLEEFEKKFPFKVGDLCIYSSDIIDEDFVVKILGMTIKDDCIMYEVGHKNISNKHSYIYRRRETLKPYKEMNTRNVTLTLDKAKEWYNKGGELREIALQAFSEKELTKVNLPKTFKEFCKNYPVKKGECWLGNCDQIDETDHSEKRIFKNWIPSRQSAEAHLALIQLEQLRDCCRGLFVTVTGMPVWCIIRHNGRLIISPRTWGMNETFLSFQSKKVAEEYLKNFKPLIEKAGDLI